MDGITRSRSGVSRSKAARIVGSHPETIRYYEKIGLISPPQRTASGYRQYFEGDLSRLSFIVKLRTLGFRVDDIRVLLDDSRAASPACQTVAQIAGEHLITVKKKMAELKKLETVLVDLLSDCSRKDVTGCRFVERLVEIEVPQIRALDTKSS